jgi:hypothetical protein
MGPIGVDPGTTLFKTEISATQPAKVKQAITETPMLTISGTRFEAEPRLKVPINHPFLHLDQTLRDSTRSLTWTLGDAEEGHTGS